MKNILHIIPLLILLVLSSACEEVIELELENAEAQLVVEANLTDQPLPFTVRLSKSAGFYDTGNYPAVGNATVSLKELGGEEVWLTEVEPGLYQSSELIGKMGKSYQLHIESEGQEIEATSTIMPKLSPDSISFLPVNRGFQNEGGLQGFVHFQDPAGEETYLRFLLLINDTIQSNLILYEDGLRDGQRVQYPLFGPTFHPGDKVQLLTLSLDRDAHAYLNSLADITGQAMGPGAAAPANPSSNLSGGALGYFVASGVSVYETVVQ